MLATLHDLPAFASAFDIGLASWASEAQLQAHQRRRLAALLTHAARCSPIYREILAGVDPSRVSLQALPVQHRQALMHRFDDWVTDRTLKLADLQRFVADPSRIGNPYPGGYTIWESSGTGGKPGIFIQDAAAMAVYDALEGVRRLQLRPVHGLLPPWFAGIIAFVGAVDGHFASTVSLKRLRRLNPWLSGWLRSLSFLQPLADLVNQLQRLTPAVIATYPSMACLLAQERISGRLGHAPREFWTGGETLSCAMRRYLQDAFGCPVVDSYGASEFLALAHECSAGRLHLNCDWAILESVDREGLPVPEGQAGSRTLLTHLANYVQPLIRYELGDEVKLGGCACSCGSHLPVIEVRGREDDILRLASAGQREVALSPLALTTVLEEQAGLFDFELSQLGPSELRLCTSSRGKAADRHLSRARRVLEDYLRSQGAPRVRIHCVAGAPCRQGRSGKAKRIVRP